MRLIEKKTGIAPDLAHFKHNRRFDLLRAAPEITGDAYQVKHARFLIWPGWQVYFILYRRLAIPKAHSQLLQCRVDLVLLDSKY